MKQLILFCLIAVSTLMLAGADSGSVQVSFRPVQPEAGESVYVTVIANTTTRNGATLILPELSSSAKWNHNMRSDGTSMSVTNSGQPQISYRFTRQLFTSKPGKLEIPPFRVRTGSGELVSKATTLEILPAGSRKKSGPASLKPFGELTTSPDRPLRPGENVTISLKLFIPANLQLLNVSGGNLSGLGSAMILKNKNSRETFAPQNSYETVIKGSEYIVLPFTAVARTAVSGDFFPELVLTLTLREMRHAERDDFDDDIFNHFFSSGRNYGRPQSFTLSLKDHRGFKVVPLPALPAGVTDVGLTGKWHCSAKFSTPSCRSGEVAELEMKFTPQSRQTDIARIPFKAPELQVDNFRVYPPEVIRKNGIISVRWAMIPLSAGEKKLSFKLACFDPGTNRWQISELYPVLAVTPGRVNVLANTAKNTEKQPLVVKSTDAAVSPIPTDALHYLKAYKDANISVPLWLNQKTLIIVLLSIAVLLLIFDALCRHVLPGLLPENYRAKRQLKKSVRSLCRQMKSSDDLIQIVKQHGISEIAQLSGLPAGATAQDIADSVDDPEVKGFFTALAQESFAPGNTAVPVSGNVKNRLIKYLKHLGIIICSLLVLNVSAGSAESANAAYDSGNYPLAAEEYRRMLHNDHISVALLYNLGCTEYKLGNLPAAKVWFTRATLLSPGDAECRANLELVNSRLQLASAENPTGFTSQLTRFRDSLGRPDQYLALAAAGIVILCILFILRGRGGSVWRWSVAGAVLFLTVLALWAAMTQADSSYSPDNLILTGKNPELRSLPVEKSGTVLKKLIPGSNAVLMEKRGSWLRINCDGVEGWLPEDQAMRVFPYGIL